MNILELISSDGFQFSKVSNTRGGEHHGPCPFCGGNDRFRIQPAQDRYYCRGCGQKGDSIQYLRDFRKMDYFEALILLGREPVFRKSAPIFSPPKLAEPTTPPELWQEKGTLFALQSAARLWEPTAAAGRLRQWLHDEKGLSDATIKAAGLGYNSADIYEPRATWGLPEALNDKGNPKKVWLPGGLVIPFLQDGKVQRLRFRRSEPGDGERYIIVSGSSSAPMAWGTNKGAVVVVESELDGLLLQQEAGDLAAVVALGSAQAKPDGRADALLRSAKTILIALDSDAAGAKAAWSFWPKQYGKKVKRWPCIGGKDPSDARLAGLNLRTWVEAGLPDTPATDETQHQREPDAKSPLPCEPPPADACPPRLTFQNVKYALPCEPPPPADALTGAGLHKLIKGEPVLDFADGLATRLFMAKANFTRDHDGQTVTIRQMDFLTIPEAEIQDLLRAGLVKADRDLRTLH